MPMPASPAVGGGKSTGAAKSVGGRSAAHDHVSAALLLFLILDPLGNIPVFLSLLKPLPPARRRIVLLRELLIALGVLFGIPVGRHLRPAD